jgi:hypothetical protein
MCDNHRQFHSTPNHHQLHSLPLPMKDFGDLIVCSSNSSENYWHMVEPRFPVFNLSPCPISVSETPFPCHLLAYSIAAR